MPITLNNELAGFLSDGLFFRRCHCTATCPQSLTTSNIKYALIGLKQPDVTAFLTLLDHELEHDLVLTCNSASLSGKHESKWLPEWWEATKLRHRNEATKCFCDCFRKCTVHGCCFGFWNIIHGRCFLTFSILACVWLFGIIPCLGLQNSAFCWSIPSSYLLKVTISIYIPPQILKWLAWNPDRYIMKLLIIMYGLPLEHHVFGLLLSSMNC